MNETSAGTRELRGPAAWMRRRLGETGRLVTVQALCTAMVLGPLYALAGSAAAAQPEDQRPAPPRPVLVLEHKALGDMFVSEKDAPLKRALGMLPARIRELPREIPDLQEMPAPLIELVVQLLSQPGRIALTYSAEEQSGGAFGAGFVWSIGPMPKDDAAAMQGRVSAMLEMSGAPIQAEPSSAYAGMSEAFLPFGLVRFGPREMGGRWHYDIHVGSLADPDAPFASLPDIAGGRFEPVMRGMFDPAPLTPLINMAGMFAAGRPEAMTFFNGLRESGVIGPDAVRHLFSSGYTNDASLTISIAQGQKKYAQWSEYSQTPLAAEHFRAVPADATMASVTRLNISAIRDQIAGVVEMAPPVGQAIEQFYAATGVDLIDDLLGPLGDVWGGYLSDSTGGGGLGSAVMFASLADRGRFEASLSKLAGFANEMVAQSPAQGHVRVRSWTHGDAKMMSLNFPGIPLPLEPTWTVAGDWFIIGLTPQAVVTGAAQAMGRGDRGLASNPRFTQVVGKDRGDAVSVSFVDTPRVMRDGYQCMSLIGSAIGNLTRSAFDESREPGMIVPTYAELAKDARAMVSVKYWSGEDLVTESYSDRSTLVNGAGIAGAASPFIPLIGLAVAAAAAGKARQSAMETRWEYEQDMEMEIEEYEDDDSMR